MTVASPGPARIRKLPRDVVDRIAAGEVVERPASVVKELVENALDAGARRVEVEIRGGGIERIVVKDDGIGMGPPDLELAFTSHATSKLAEVADLDHIASFGFRGEALASIGAVADVRIVSREPDADGGYAIESRGGRRTDVAPAAAAPGTTVDVRNLFKYVPARRKFLRAAGTESSHVTTAVQRLALAHPGVGFVLVRDGRAAFRVLPEHDLPERLRTFYGNEIAGSVLPVHGADGDLVLEGFVVPPEGARKTATGYQVFLNGRFVRDRTLQHAIRHAFEGLLTSGRHPVAFLFLTIDPATVDVNVHPAKLEVRFHESRRVHRLVEESVRRALLRADLSPNPVRRLLQDAGVRTPAGALEKDRATYLDGVRDALADFLAGPASTNRTRDPSMPFPEPSSAPLGTPAPRDVAPPGPAEQRALPLAEARGVRRFLQVKDLFLVFETDDGGLAIADQHALHERILLEELKERLREGGLEVQPFLLPEVLELPAADVELLVGEREALESLGVRIDRFGETAVAVHALPALLATRDPARVVGGVLDRLRDGKSAGSRAQLLESILHSMACRGAIMSGDPLTEEQAAELMRQAGRIDTSQGCAHGRPTALKIPFRDLIQHFGRSLPAR